jgi:Fe-S oxidoreductase
MLGEMGLFQHLMEKNMETFRKMGVKKIIAFDPHAYNALKNYYPIGEFDVVHYTQLVRDLVVNDKLRFSGKLDCKVTYHDPCFLGRYNEVYEQPRKILNSIPGLELVEMDHNREDSFCCGGGNANYITDLIGAKENSPARARVREAYSTGAQILGVACPICQIMMEDALKSEDLEGKMAIKSVAELALDALS